MGRIRVLVAADGLTAAVQVEAGPAAAPSELAAALASAGLQHGIDATTVASLAARLQDLAGAGSTIVARGQPALPGVDGSVVPTFPGPRQAGIARADGSLDYHERGLLHPVVTGSLVARVVPATAGTPGRDVCGRTLPAVPGKPFAVQCGPGVRLEHNTVLALRDGVVVQDGARFDVLPLWEHKGNCDLASGNLHTTGSIRISGDVTAGAVVEAGGDVLVGGAVLDGRIDADGSVLVAQGILGLQAEVQCGRDLHCRHATAALLQTGGNLRALDQLAKCRVLATNIELSTGRGTAFGGELRARDSIVLLQAGHPGGADTLLSVGDMAAEQGDLVRATTVAVRADRRAQKAAGPGGRGKGRQFGREAVATADAAMAQKLELAQRQRTLLKAAYIEVRGTVHPGVRIQFGRAVRSIEEPMTQVRFRWHSESTTIVEETP